MALLAAIILALLVVFVIKSKKLKDKLVKFKNDMIWNGLITSLHINMFRYCIKSNEQLKLRMQGSIYLSTTHLLCAEVMLIILWVLISFIFFFLYTRKYELDRPQMIAKCGNMYAGLNTSNNWQLFRFPVQITYIYLFSIICSMLVNFSGLQEILIIQLHLLLLGFMFNSSIIPKSDDRLQKFTRIFVHSCVL